MFRDLLGRTIAMVSIATALVAVSVALDLPRTGAGPGAGGHGGAGPAHASVTSEAAFIAAMIPHHQEAVDAARAVMDAGERAEVRALAAEIVVAQGDEIATLTDWLAAWYPDREPAPYAPTMRRLEGLRPLEVDLVFVADMIQHHEMAILMAEEALGLTPPPRPEVAALARDVVRVQAEEIATLRGWLEAWSAAPAPHR